MLFDTKYVMLCEYIYIYTYIYPMHSNGILIWCKCIRPLILCRKPPFNNDILCGQQSNTKPVLWCKLDTSNLLLLIENNMYDIVKISIYRCAGELCSKSKMWCISHITLHGQGHDTIWCGLQLLPFYVGEILTSVALTILGKEYMNLLRLQ